MKKSFTGSISGMRLTIRRGRLLFLDSLDGLGSKKNMMIHSENGSILIDLNSDILVIKNETLLIAEIHRYGCYLGFFNEDKFLTLLSYGLSKKVKKQTTGK